jgi:hypothetical protein
VGPPGPTGPTGPTGPSTLINVSATTTNATYYVVGVTSSAINTTPWLSTSVFYNASTNALTATSHVSSSDERLKTNWRDLPTDYVELLSQVKHGVFDRLDDGNTRVGVSAQSLRKVLENAVLPGDKGYLTVDYGPAALVSCIMLAQRVLELEKKLEEKQ